MNVHVGVFHYRVIYRVRTNWKSRGKWAVRLCVCLFLQVFVFARLSACVLRVFVLCVLWDWFAVGVSLLSAPHFYFALEKSWKTEHRIYIDHQLVYFFLEISILHAILLISDQTGLTLHKKMDINSFSPEDYVIFIFIPQI